MIPARSFFLVMIAALIVLSVNVYANDTALSSYDAYPTQEVLVGVDRLIDDKKYESAWTLLHENAETLDFADLMVRKTKLSLRYFVLTNMHGMFAFTDLKEGEDLIDLRKQQGNYELKLFDPAGGLKLALEKNPQRADLYYWLGEFYNEVLSYYGSGWLESQEELRNQMRENFEKALALGMETEDIYSKLAHTELLAGDWDKAEEHLSKAMSYDREDPAYYQNIAIAQLNQNRLALAEVNAEMAINLYEDPYYKADTCFLASTIALYRSREDSAENYLKKGFEQSPDDYRFPDRLIRLYLSQKRFEDARISAGDLFGLYPENPETCTTIIQYFYNQKKLDETEGFFEVQLNRFSERPAVLGNLYFHQAVAAQYQDLDDQALVYFDLAEGEFRKVYSEDHQVFDAIEKIVGKINNN